MPEISVFNIRRLGHCVKTRLQDLICTNSTAVVCHALPKASARKKLNFTRINKCLLRTYVSRETHCRLI
jgi:hypothetical protein